MGRGWRTAFCTRRPRTEIESDVLPNEQQQTPNISSKLGFLSSISNPSTPRLRIRTSNIDNTSKNPSSPRSPFSVLKNTLRLSKSSCPLCLHSLKAAHQTPIYTAQCSHAFHYPCIASHVHTQPSLVCPVCNVPWKDAPLLAFHLNKVAASSTPATPTSRCFPDKLTPASYNDDEPLVSPCYINHFPEIQGSNIIPKSPKLHVQSSKNVEVKLLPEAVLVSGSRFHETYAVVLRVKAPSRILSTKHRAPIDLVAVLDVSMMDSKLQMLKRAMKLVVSSLSSIDRLSIVAFASSPQRLLPLCRMTSQGQKTACKIIDQLDYGQGTSVSEALRHAAKVLEERREKNPICSIILLSNGKNDYNNGCGSDYNTSDSERGSASRFTHIEVPVHPAGFAFRTALPRHDTFAKCVSSLLRVVVQDLRVQLGFSNGSAPAEIMAVYSCNGSPTLMSSESARLGDMYAEEEREVLVELKVPTSSLGAHHVMCVRCSYKDPVTREVMYGRERALLVPRPQAGLRVEQLKSLFIYTRDMAESRRLVDHGDYTSVHHLISSARSLVMQPASADEYARGLEAELAHAHRMRRYQLEKKEVVDENRELLSSMAARRAAEKLAKVATINKSLNMSVSDLHGFKNARF